MHTEDCYHCGSECKEDSILFQEKNFCCHGCKTVFQLLSSNDLCEYYAIDKEQPGIKTAKIESSKYDYLDEPEILKEVLDFSNDTFASVSLYIPQIHCYSCLWLLEMLHKIHPGIRTSKVNYLKKELTVTYLKSETTLKDLVAKLASIGYAPHIEKNNAENKRFKKQNKQLIYQLGVAGFCFGNVMFLTFPEYFALENEIDPEISSYFGYVNLLLSTILVLFSARNYFLSAFQSLKFKRVNLDVPIAIGIVTIYFHGLYEVLTATGSGYFDSLSGLIFFLLLGRLFQNKTFEQFNFERDYQSYFPMSATKIVDGAPQTISLNQFKIGDKIIVKNEEIVPADCVLVSKEASIDYSFVTGESLPETCVQNHQIQAGGRNKGQNIELLVVQLPSQSYLTKLWNQSSVHKLTSISKLSDQLGSQFTSRVLILALGASIYWYFADPSLVIKVFTSILIVACPCALALAIPITYGNALRVLGDKRFYLKHANVIEDLAKVDHLIFDKTGTLTIANDSKVEFVGGELSELVKSRIAALLQNSTHVLSKTVSTFLGSSSTCEIQDFKEHSSKGIEALVDNVAVKAGSSEWILNKTHLGNSSEVHIEYGGAYLGFFTIHNAYRENTAAMFADLSKEYKMYVLSGDNDAEKTILSRIAPMLELKFKQSPFDKKNFIEALKEKGFKTLMIGDGLNDAGALMSADVGVAVSENSANFTPASDAILEANDINKLPLFLNYAKASIYVVYACFGLSFFYNLIGLFFAVQGKLSPVVSAILMPLSSVSVLLLSLGLSYLVKKRVFGEK